MISSWGAARAWLIAVVCIAAGAAAAAGYGLTAPKTYRATAKLLVAPVSPADPTFAGIGVLRDTGGKRTAAADVAALLETPQIADAVAAQLALKRSRTSLLRAVHARVVDESDVVAVTAADKSGGGAAQLANTFANALITQRSATFQSDLAAAIHRDEQLIGGISPARRATGEGAAIVRRLTTLRGLQNREDPTVRVASQAVAPTAASWPSLPRLIGVGTALGAALGMLVMLAAFALRRWRGAAGSRAAGPQYDRQVSDGAPENEPENEAVEKQVVERLAVEEQALEQLVDRLEARLVARESALAARERDVQAALAELRAAQEASADRAPPAAADDSELRRREEQLSERIRRVTAREVELARRVASVALRERKLDERPEPEPEPLPAPVTVQPDPVPAAPVDTHAVGHYNLLALERLAEQHGAEFPDRTEEWTAYLFFLRDHAAPDGSVPARFDALIAETFHELV